ncbi:MAG TPA: response regulator [Bryobacteraceae bacterium]|nr:response regulator [Bryobacteraceae bacterium]
MPTESVLIVEDTPINLKVVQCVMQRAGFDVRTATSAEEALEVLKQFRPSLVLTDIQLPGMNGVELIKRLKADPGTRDTIVLALTAFAMKSDEQKAFDAGCDGYITKPIDTRTFPNLIRQYIAPSHGTHSNASPASAPKVARLEFSLRDIQQTFVAEGMRQSERFINALNDGSDYSEVRVAAHRWVGAAGQIGYPEIAQNARELEALLQQSGLESIAPVREVLVRLMQLFSEAQEAGRRLPPASVAEEMSPANTIDGTPTAG